MTPERTFRDDINGLRAWAVVSVILFHFGIPGFDGGFVGVDIFFVISGFLMTGIIIRALEHTRPDGKHSLSLINFYLSRGRRIIPALLVLCMTLLAAGWFFLPASEYRMLGTHSTSALGFLSNIKFWSEAGYFDAASHEKWLLHTWSLSVEWQFYMILPIIMLSVWKVAPGRNATTIVLSGILAASLALSVFTSHTSPSAAFYMLHTRAWEMLAGGLVFLLNDRMVISERARRHLYFFGFALLAVSIAAFDSATIWPGANALMPVAGTVMVLIANCQNGLFSGHSVFQRLGDWSYSLYLWHWPIAVALVYLSLQNNTVAIAFSLTLTLVAGWISYRSVETPSRMASAKFSTYGAAAILAALTLIAALPGAGIYLNNGFPGRLPPDIEVIFQEANNKNPRMKECHISKGIAVPECTYGGNKLGAIVIGDSHAASIVRTVESVLPSPDLHVLDWTLGSCPTVLELKRVNDSSFRCGDFLKQAMHRASLMDPAAPLIVMNRLSTLFWGPNEPTPRKSTAGPIHYVSAPHAAMNEVYREEMREKFINAICGFSETRAVYIVRPTPELILNVPKTMGRAAQAGVQTQVSIPREEYNKRHEYSNETINIAAEKCNAIVLDPAPLLCNDEVCAGDLNGLPIYYDDDHLNERGANMLAPLFQEIFADPIALSQLGDEG